MILGRVPRDAGSEREPAGAETSLCPLRSAQGSTGPQRAVPPRKDGKGIPGGHPGSLQPRESAQGGDEP